MIRCKDVAWILSSDEFRALGLWQRVRVRAHLFLCKDCTTFARQLDLIGSGLRELAAPDEALEQRIISKLLKREKS